MEATLEGRVGLVTGATSGIGLAIATRLAERGAHVTCCARRGGAEVLPHRCAFVGADVRRHAEVAAVCAAIRADRGRMDFVVANAGVAHQGTLVADDQEAWRTVLATNLLGVANTVHAAVAVMRERGSGHVVLLASAAGYGTHAGEPIYLASKWGVVGLGRALRWDLRADGIRVTIVAPGLVDTPLVRASEQASRWLSAVDPLRPEDVADVVVEAIARPSRLTVNEIILRPSDQEV